MVPEELAVPSFTTLLAQVLVALQYILHREIQVHCETILVLLCGSSVRVDSIRLDTTSQEPNTRGGSHDAIYHQFDHVQFWEWRLLLESHIT